jgi:Ca-activated chloride channel family protein
VIASCLLFAAVVAALPASAADDDPNAAADDDGPGFLLRAGSRLPLLSQETTVDVSGPVARVRLTQRWRNDGDATIDATYTIPASTKAAVHDLTLTVGTRVVRADVQEKKQAAATFDAARAAGHTAGLLNEVRDNVLRLTLANLRPHEEVVVRLEESLTLDRNDGVWELALPQTTGPRYGDGVPTTHVASSTLAGRMPSTRIDVRVNEPLPMRAFGSTTHAVKTSFDGPTFARARIESSKDDPVANRDFVLRFSLAGDDVAGGVLAYRGEGSDEGTFLLMAEPPEALPADKSTPREVIFVVDVSGSMGGFPLQVASGLLHDLVDELRPRDRFNVLFFSGGNWTLAPQSVPATKQNLAAAKEALASMRGGGGTELLPALQAALQTPRPKDDDGAFARSFVVVTDGFVTVEQEASRLVADHIDDATLFAFGIGSSVNRALIESLARIGHTSPVIVTDPSEAPTAVDRFVRDARPALTDVVLDTSRAPGFVPFDVEPAGDADADVDVRLPDLYAGRALAVLGRFTGTPSGRLVLRGRTSRGPWQREIRLDDVDATQPGNEVLEKMWARRRVQRLAELGDGAPCPREQDEDGLCTGRTEDATNKAILALGLQYRLLTSQTSFVVVDSDARGAAATGVVDQPSLLPEGMDASFGSLGSLGLRGSGAGGGGLGTFGTAGFGSGAIGYGAGRGTLSDRAPSVAGSLPTTLGSIAPEVIRRVVRTHAAQIRSCYERVLARVPGLAGKVVVKWTIDGQGHVVDATIAQTQLKNAEVEACLLQTVRTWRFPPPAGTQRVTVNYPFVFQQGG